MKNVTGLICPGLLYAGVLWIEYEIALLLGIGCFFFIGAAALAVMGVAVRRAPEGVERPDGFHVRHRGRETKLVPPIRFSQPARVRQ